jgi:hypothetical protein
MFRVSMWYHQTALMIYVTQTCRNDVVAKPSFVLFIHVLTAASLSLKPGAKVENQEKRLQQLSRCDKFSKMSYFELKTKFGDSLVLDNAVLQDRPSGIPYGLTNLGTGSLNGGNGKTRLGDLLAEPRFPPKSKTERE